MAKPTVSCVLAGPETDRFIHLRVFGREDRPAPPYSTDERIAQWLADKYDLDTIPIMESLAEDAKPVAFMVVRHVEPHEDFEGHLIDIEPLAQGDTIPLAIARSVLLIEGLVERDFVAQAP